MNGKKFRWKGLLAVLCVAAALVLLFTILGRTTGDSVVPGNMAKPELEKVDTVQSRSYALTISEDSSAESGESESAGLGNFKQVTTTFSETIADDTPSQTDRKIIQEGSVYIETEDFDKSMSALDLMVSQYGGFTEKKDITGSSYYYDSLKHATVVIRIPSQNFETVMEQMGTVGVVTRSSASGTDITDEYIDYEARLRNLKAQEETLLEILSKAEKLEDVITLESRISEVRYDIETIENKLKNYDRLVQYSRITVQLDEVVEPTRAVPVARTLGDRMYTAFQSAIDSFTDGIENFLVWVVYNWILLTAILIIIILLVIVIKVMRRRKKAAVTVNVESEGTDDADKDADKTDE